VPPGNKSSNRAVDDRPASRLGVVMVVWPVGPVMLGMELRRHRGADVSGWLDGMIDCPDLFDDFIDKLLKGARSVWRTLNNED